VYPRRLVSTLPTCALLFQVLSLRKCFNHLLPSHVGKAAILIRVNMAANGAFQKQWEKGTLWMTSIHLVSAESPKCRTSGTMQGSSAQWTLVQSCMTTRCPTDIHASGKHTYNVCSLAPHSIPHLYKTHIHGTISMHSLQWKNVSIKVRILGI
jgi:hypothetical protein